MDIERRIRALVGSWYGICVRRKERFGWRERRLYRQRGPLCVVFRESDVLYSHIEVLKLTSHSLIHIIFQQYLVSTYRSVEAYESLFHSHV